MIAVIAVCLLDDAVVAELASVMGIHTTTARETDAVADRRAEARVAQRSAEADDSLNSPALHAATLGAPRRILYLQQTIGNAAVSRLIARMAVGRDGGPLEPAVAQRIEASRNGGHALGASDREKMEPAFGQDFGDVRIHDDAEADALAREVSAVAFTTGSDIFVRGGPLSASSGEAERILAHELTHVVQQGASGVGPAKAVGAADDSFEHAADQTATEVERALHSPTEQPSAETNSAAVQRMSSAAAIQRQDDTVDPTITTITPEYAASLSDDQLQAQVDKVRTQLAGTDASTPEYSGGQDNLATLETEVSQRSLSQLQQQGVDFDPAVAQFVNYCQAEDTLASMGRPAADEPQGVGIPANQLLVVDENGQTMLIPDSGQIAEVGDDLVPVLDSLGNAINDGGPPDLGGEQQGLLLWNDGRAVLTPPASADIATLLIQGSPADADGASQVTGLPTPFSWDRVQQAAPHAFTGAGIYQLGTFPISRFSGVSLPPGSRIRFADPAFRGAETRFATIFEPGTKRFFAWDAHAPVGGTPHNFWHVNQKGMHPLFGLSNHADIPPAQLGAARGLRYVKFGGRVFLLVGVFIDAYQLGAAGMQSIEQGTPAPVIAQAVRTVGGWAGAWAGAKAGCAVGAAAGVETGPGMALTCLVGGVAGGFIGYFAADWVADMISED